MVSLAESTTGFIVRYGEMRVDLETELNRFYLEVKRNIFSLKRGETYEEQLRQRSYLRRSFVIRLRGSLFTRSRVLVELRPECPSSGYLVLIAFHLREPQQETHISFGRPSFSDGLLDASVNDFLPRESDMWGSLIEFMENSLLLTHNPLKLRYL